MPSSSSPLAPFHPIVQRWFEERIGTPTDVQAKAWPEIAAGHNVLATAPTGSGKTLTAFLWALDSLLTGKIPPADAGREKKVGGGVRVLYVSPLKALNSDVGRNLETPLAELQKRFETEGVPAPTVHTMTRSGDTPQNERQKMIRRPPEILITTPESLNILLTSKGGRSILGGIETLILDEVHAVYDSKRGVHLMTAVERLTLLSGEFQRIALSATVRPLEAVAEWVGGAELVDGPGEEPVYRPRPVRIVRSETVKEYELSVRFPEQVLPDADGVLDEDAEQKSVWDLLVPEIKEIIRRHRSTLVFANSRRLTEKITRMLNEDEVSDLAYSHHGSLSREVRSVVEERLKRGELPAIVATNSLELGIDIGALDEVVLLQTPKSIASAIQRIGRAGHQVGEVSRGTLFPSYGRDFLDAAVVVRSVRQGEVEPKRPVRAPLDVLAQVVLSMVVADPWRLEDLYAFLLTASPYRDLSRRHFDLVVEMLAGRYADARLRELEPRISVDKVDGTVRARKSAERLIYMSGGTIPDRGYFHLRVASSMARIGELDEEFVWERSPGDTFTLGTQMWRIQKITHNDVLVEAAFGSAGMAPFWRADERDRDFFFSRRVAEFLEEIEPRLAGRGEAARGSDGERDDTPLVERLETESGMDRGAAVELVEFLARQAAVAGGRLPHRHRLLVERVRPGDAGGGVSGTHPLGPDRRQIVLHTLWGGQVNRPFAIALAAAWEEEIGSPIEILHDDDCILATVPAADQGVDLLSLVHPDRVEELLRRRLEATGFFGAHFRRNAGRALLLPKAGFKNRTPLWLNRARAKRLLEAVGEYGDFPVVLETWRTCLQDALDLPALATVLGEVRGGGREMVEVLDIVTTEPSPFAAGLLWKQTNQLMYADDVPDGEGTASGGAIRGDLLRELVFSSHLRPRLSGLLLEEFRRKVQRVAPGYAPRDATELLDWVKERLLLPLPEWRELLDAMERDERTDEPVPERVRAIAPRAVSLELPDTTEPVVVAVENLPRIAAGFGVEVDDLNLAPLPGGPAIDEARDALAHLSAVEPVETSDDPLAELLGEWLRFYGPVPETFPAEVWGLDEATWAGVLKTLIESETAVVDELSKDAPGREMPEVCEAGNLEVLLRWARAAGRPTFEALPLERLPLALAQHQGLTAPGTSLDDLQSRLESLFALPAPARAWEEEILPARMDPYRGSWLDTLLLESDLAWVGAGEEKLLFAFPSDLELIREVPDDPEGGDEDDAIARLFPAASGRFSLEDLVESADSTPVEISDRLWSLAWAGRVTTDSFAPVRQGVATDFRPPRAPRSREPAAPVARTRRRWSTDRWQSRQTSPGRWTPLPPPSDEPPDALEQDELAKDRARLLLARYGVVFRELCQRELTPFQWSRVFRALRLMELAGEVVTGQFFQGVLGLQFATPEAFRRLREGQLDDDSVYWMNAADPASLAGVDLPDLKSKLPERRRGNHLVFHGERLVVTSRRQGKTLDILVPPDHPRLGEYLGFLKVALTRDARPRGVVAVEEINGELPRVSPYLDRFRELFDAAVEYGNMKLRRRY